MAILLDKKTASRSTLQLQGELDAILEKVVSGQIPEAGLQKAKDRASFLARVILRRQGINA
jgi:hypothetical protein